MLLSLQGKLGVGAITLVLGNLLLMDELGEPFYLRALPVKWLIVAGLGFQCLLLDPDPMLSGDLLALLDNLLRDDCSKVLLGILIWRKLG